MILVTGGCFQGKTAYACETFGIAGEEAVDGRVCALEDIYRAKLLYHFHEYIRRLTAQEQPVTSEIAEQPVPREPSSFAKQLLRENPDIVLVTNELGYGVVPIDKFDREYRERTGRICCEIAKRAREVHRVVCGLGMVIKHD